MNHSRLTKRQQEILNFIETYFDKNGYPPTIREIGKGMGLNSTSTVHGHLTRLVKKRYITKEDYKPRAISSSDTYILKENNNSYVNIPVVGNVAAGTPILAVANIEETYPVPANFIDFESQYFILKIKGESMIKAGIIDGDYALIKQQNTSNDGQIVVALIDDSATVKTFYREENHIRLQPENPSMEAIIVKDAKIIGLVEGVFRKI